MSTHPSTTESSGIHEISGVLVRVVRVLMLTSRTRLMSTFTRVSKGLLNIASELVVQLPNNCKLDELRSILSRHRAFQNVSRENPMHF